MKKEKIDYFKLFIRQATASCEAAALLLETVRGFDPAHLPESVEKIHSVERAADEIKGQLIEALTKEFLPPIEREDIMQIAQELDNVTDAVDDVVLHFYMYNLTQMPPEAVRFAEIVYDGCKLLLEAVTEFSNFKKSSKLKPLLIAVNSNEDKGDALFAESMRKLYSEDVEPRALISWTKIYEIMEDCCDTCEHAADMMESAVLKNT